MPVRALALIVCVSTLAFVLLRCVQLEADPPMSVFGYNAPELFAEPPAKSHEARNYAVFGSFKLSAHDSYQFWRAQSPFWVYPLTGFFRAFGVDYPQLRIFSTLYAAAGLALLLVLGARFMRPAALAFVGLAITIDAVYFHTSRVGFIEPAMSSWLTLSVLALVAAEQRAAWLCLALTAAVIAFFTKQGALLAAPVVLGALIVRLRALDPADRNSPRTRALVLGSACVLLAASAIYIGLTDYVRTAVHNLNHLALGYDAPPGEHVEGLRSVLARAVDLKRYQHLIATVPVTGPLAAATAAVMTLRAARARRWPRYAETLLLGWFACALVALGALANSALRFWTVLIPPAALLAGIAVDRSMRWLEQRQRAGAARVLLASVLVWLVSWNGALHRAWLGQPSFSMRDASHALERVLGDAPATVIGTLSPWIVLPTPYRNFYVRPMTNSSPGTLRGLGVTHLLSRDQGDAALDIARREYGGALREHGLHLTVRGEPITVFELTAGPNH